MKNPVFLVRHMHLAMKVHESVKKRVKLAVRPRKFATHKNTRDLVKTSEYQSLSNGFRLIKQKAFVLEKWSWMEHKWQFSHWAYACARESVRTQDMGQGESHSHPWHVDV